MSELLREISATEAGRYSRRLHGVLLARSLPVAEVARLLGVSRRAVQYWLRAYRGSGPLSLKAGARRGRPPMLAGSALERVAEALNGGAPAAAGGRPGAWTGAALRRFIERRCGLRLGLRQCQRILKRRGVTPAAEREALLRYGAMT